jgi:PBP1b-binding outer membrane lipoprotein LpoB
MRYVLILGLALCLSACTALRKPVVTQADTDEFVTNEIDQVLAGGPR